MSRFMSIFLVVLSMALALTHITPAAAEAGGKGVTKTVPAKHSSWDRDQHCGPQCDAYGSFDDQDCSVAVVNGKSSSTYGLIGFSSPITLSRRGSKSRSVTQLAVHLARDVKRGSSTSSQGSMQLGLYQQEQRNKKNINSWKLIAQTQWEQISKRSNDKYAFYDLDKECEVELSNKYNYRVAMAIAPKSSVNVYASDKTGAFVKHDLKDNKRGSNSKRRNLPSRYVMSSDYTATLDMEMISCSNSTSSK